MGEAKRRGTYEQRVAEALELKQRFVKAMLEHRRMQGKGLNNRALQLIHEEEIGKTVTGRIPSSPEIQELPAEPDRVWYDEAWQFTKESFGSVNPTKEEEAD